MKQNTALGNPSRPHAGLSCRPGTKPGRSHRPLRAGCWPSTGAHRYRGSEGYESKGLMKAARTLNHEGEMKARSKAKKRWKVWAELVDEAIDCCITRITACRNAR
ncbi:hypothetical protein LZ31DRAFT_558561 [Colletotrichum somersetense]|nr:hypothetical protein LZ31DRAFT_558561 [Colletotrichum somersetense]